MGVFSLNKTVETYYKQKKHHETYILNSFYITSNLNFLEDFQLINNLF
jgi:hypothetical protein